MFTAALIYILAVISPGPNFIIVSRFSSLGSVSTGIGATLGICTVGVFFSTISLLGLAALLHQYPAFSKVATLCGSAYLLYIAYSIIRSVLAKSTGTPESTGPGVTSFARAYRVGLITNISNMKTIAFMISIYAGFLSSPRSELDKVLVVLLCSTLEITWYSLVALLFGQGPIKALFLKYTRQIDVGLAVFLVAFSLNNAVPVLLASR
ncbi:LysE family translocator [Pseudomonas gingeri]|uniref:LysE family translocator n=1 Tax=Pseudomonas gingeri TaxID=117681 RepID=UPI0015A2BAF3|nr:LysE family translocator [Pseudomonas gingeri]NVZ28620.1 LysE family translocator [Pseudomonas gingeri]